MAEGPADGKIEIDEVLYLRRVVSRLTLRAEQAEEAADRYAALCDMLSAKLNELEGQGHGG